MTYAINVKINGEEKTVIIDKSVPNAEVKSAVQAVVDFSLPEEREKVVSEFINEVNRAFKNCACASIVENYPGDMVKGILMRIPYASYKYNAGNNTLSYFEVAEKDNVPVFTQHIELDKYIRFFNKGKDDKEKISMTGDFKRKTWALLVIARHAILGELTEADIAKIKDIAENKSELFKDERQLKAFKGFCKLSVDNEVSKTAQQDILDFFYSEFNKKTGYNIKAVNKFKNKDGKEITAFEFIRESGLRKVNSVTKTVKVKDEKMLFNILCNMYITSEQALNVQGKGAKIEDAFATLNPVEQDGATA